MHTTARYFLDGLLEAGIDHVFSNLGTDHVTLVEELAQAQLDGRAVPSVVLCPHENVAIHMAGGYAAVTGRGQGVMVHVDAGTANAAMGLHNLMRSRLPVLLVVAFLAGLVPMLILHRATRWRLRRKLDVSERSVLELRAAAAAPARPLGEIGLGEDHHARGAQTPHDFRILHRQIVDQCIGARRGRHADRVDIVLENEIGRAHV